MIYHLTFDIWILNMFDQTQTQTKKFIMGGGPLKNLWLSTRGEEGVEDFPKWST